jgi:outer membrane murein-binding lipoprotein Lpp
MSSGRPGSTVADMMRRSCARVLSVSALLLASAMLAGCSGDEDTPAICSSVDSLKASVADVTNVDLNPAALTTLQDNVDQVRSDLSQVKSDADDQYPTEIAGVDQATSSVTSSLDAATASPSAQTIAAVATSVQALGTSLTALNDAVKSTC